ncbi:hypothetical protein K493DRAFT_311841 [Basidiobolus meristosporus CBS 931.73]|uniref:Uncharacterized protein n=1 Tax=Basidiobolus meristosporus CBS 931.73 TaxID=1314790 RepID=A0A1Y1YZH9_9FUNG|nr:hypothetical protein K493DRAFT_311841 [Basidiobolus meristosporus CBS 931.73]|eukprot:ORY03097.1 hypothetical protein K493DRAFT_311841 [Basidiobolus meristosporus CBS 931.73]
MAKRKQRVQKAKNDPVEVVEAPVEDDSEDVEPTPLDVESDQEVEVEPEVEPPKKKGKKGKKFADQSTMLSLIDQIADVQDEKIDRKLKKEAEILNHIEKKERESDSKQKLKKEKLEMMKQQLKQGKLRRLPKPQSSSETPKAKKRVSFA